MSIDTVLKNFLSKKINEKISHWKIDNPPNINDIDIPDLGSYTNGYSLQLSGGKVTSTSTKITTFEEKIANTSYQIKTSSNINIAFSNWTEDYYESHTSSGSHWSLPTHHHDTFGDFSFSIEQFNTEFDLNYTDKSANISDFKATPNIIRVNIPNGSILRGHVLPCVQKQVNNRVISQIKSNLHYEDQIKSAIEEILNGHT